MSVLIKGKRMKNGAAQLKIQVGFTLLELMISVVIVAILTSIALPNFSEKIKQTRRLEARSILLENAQFMERFFTENNRYHLRVDGVTAVVLPAQFSPRTGTALYEISFDTVAPLTAGSFTLRAVPVQGRSMENDECGTYLLNNLGVRANLNNTQMLDTCWVR
jgi:type IV pilus assembly protein PilE